MDGQEPEWASPPPGSVEIEVLTRSRRTWEGLIQSYGRAAVRSEAVRRVELGLIMDGSRTPAIRFPPELVPEVAQRLAILAELTPPRPGD